MLGYSKRINYDNFINGLIATFVIITNQSWMDIMIDHIRALDNIYACLYFIMVLIIGNFLLLNLFLAILINNFGEATEKLEKQKKARSQTFSFRKFLTSFRVKSKVFPENVIIYNLYFIK